MTRKFTVAQIIAIKAKVAAKAEAEKKTKSQAKRRGFFVAKAKAARALAA